MSKDQMIETLPEIVIPVKVSRKFVQSHPEWNFVYSADVLRKGFFGQMYNLHGEPNTYPVSVRWSGCKSSGYFNDSNPEHKEKLTDDLFDITKISNEKPLIVLRKIGEGHSQMNYFAPKLFSYMRRFLDDVCYPRLRVDWTKQYE